MIDTCGWDRRNTDILWRAERETSVLAESAPEMEGQEDTSREFTPSMIDRDFQISQRKRREEISS